MYFCREDFFGKLLLFLQCVDRDFCPALSEKVYLPDYVRKIMENADLLLDYDEDRIVGLVVLYCNDEIKKRAYIPLVGVAVGYRNRGIARNLMTRAIQMVKEKGFKVIGIHSNNPIAVWLYQSLGFKLMESGERVYMELELYSQK